MGRTSASWASAPLLAAEGFAQQAVGIGEQSIRDGHLPLGVSDLPVPGPPDHTRLRRLVSRASPSAWCTGSKGASPPSSTRPSTGPPSAAGWMWWPARLRSGNMSRCAAARPCPWSARRSPSETPPGDRFQPQPRQELPAAFLAAAGNGQGAKAHRADRRNSPARSRTSTPHGFFCLA
jgi:hypothetical protein